MNVTTIDPGWYGAHASLRGVLTWHDEDIARMREFGTRVLQLADFVERTGDGWIDSAPKGKPVATTPPPNTIPIALGVVLTPSKNSSTYHMVTSAELRYDVDGGPFWALGINGKSPNDALTDRYYRNNGWQLVSKGVA